MFVEFGVKCYSFQCHGSSVIFNIKLDFITVIHVFVRPFELFRVLVVKSDEEILINIL